MTLTAYSNAARLKRKRAARAEFALAGIPARKSRGDKRMAELAHEREHDPEPARTALSARCVALGLPATAENRAAMRATHMAETVGRLLAKIDGGKHVQRVWPVWVALTNARRVYCKSLGKSEWPKTAALEMEPVIFEVRPDDRPDLRSQDERDRAAKAAWDSWAKSINAMPTHQRDAIWYVARGTITDEQLISTTGALTSRGLAFGRAIMALASARGV